MSVKNRDAMRRLVGRTIVKIKPRAFRDGRGKWAYDPVVVLDDGTAFTFLVQETEADYGVDILLHRTEPK